MTPETTRLVLSATEIIAQPPVVMPVVHALLLSASVIVPDQVLAPLTLRRVAFCSRVRGSLMLSAPPAPGSSARVEPLRTVVPLPAAPSAVLLLMVRVMSTPPPTSVVPP